MSYNKPLYFLSTVQYLNIIASKNMMTKYALFFSCFIAFFHFNAKCEIIVASSYNFSTPLPLFDDVVEEDNTIITTVNNNHGVARRHDNDFFNNKFVLLDESATPATTFFAKGLIDEHK